MKRTLVSLSGLALMALVPVAHAQRGGSYDLSWHTLDGAGGICSGGQFGVHGTVGQPDASAPSVGGPFTLTGGFWTGLAEVGPVLKIAPASGSVIISWPASAVGFRLEHCDALGHTPHATRWTSNSSPAFIFGEDKVVVEPAVGIRFYRLVKP
jgi:hypothetical protein